MSSPQRLESDKAHLTSLMMTCFTLKQADLKTLCRNFILFTDKISFQCLVLSNEFPNFLMHLKISVQFISIVVGELVLCLLCKAGVYAIQQLNHTTVTLYLFVFQHNNMTTSVIVFLNFSISRFKSSKLIDSLVHYFLKVILLLLRTCSAGVVSQ